MGDWLMMSASDLGRAIGKGQIDPVDLTRTYLDAIDKHPLRDLIYARVTGDRAMAEAEAASRRAKSGFRLSVLDGVPISWKDLFDSAGIATEGGSLLLKNRRPESDAEVLTNATANGLICLGKTHMSELAFSGLGLNPVTATPPCVNDQDAVAGGSSSGAGTSVAFGLAAAGIGSDTGGSVRIPAAWNDLVGLKTTVGRVSVKGVVPLCARFDTVGPLCRTVEDSGLLLAALEGQKAPDLRGVSLKGVRFGALQTVAMEDLRPAPRAAYQSAVERLQAAGAIVEKFEAPEVSLAMEQTGVAMTSEAYGHWRDVIEANPDLMFHEILLRFRSGQEYSGPDFVAAWQVLDQCRYEWAARVAGFQAVICPTSPILPPNIDRLQSDHEYYVTENLLSLRNTRIANMLGLCAITLPTGVASCGISLMGRMGGEAQLLRVAKATEEALS